MTTTIKTTGPLSVTNVLHNIDGDRRSLVQDGSKLDATAAGGTVIHNTLSAEIEGTGRIVVKSSSFPTEVETGGYVVRVEAHEEQVFDVTGTTIVRQADAKESE